MQENQESVKYSVLSIKHLESTVEQLHIKSRECQKDMYEVLEYLRHTNRFRENPRYKKASFWEYLSDRFNILENTYRESVRIFNKFPEHALEYGVGMVAKIDRVCGSKKVGKVMEEISKETIAHKRPLNRVSIETIIQNNRATEKIKKEITDWKAMYLAEQLAHEKTKVALREAMCVIKKQDEQIVKLKTRAEMLNQVKDLFVNFESIPIYREGIVARV